MNLSPEENIILEMEYQKLLGDHKLIADAAKTKLMSFVPGQLQEDSNGLNSEHSLKHETMTYVKEYFNHAVLFHDQEVIKKLKELKLEGWYTRWFTSLNDIHDQYAIIRGKDIIVNAFLAFDLITGYLKIKFQFEVAIRLLSKTSGGDQMSELTSYLINLKKRKNYWGGPVKKVKDLHDFFLLVLIEVLFNKTENPPPGLATLDINTLIDVSRGKLESIFLRPLLEQCFIKRNKKMSETRYLSTLYDFFNLIVRDDTFFTEIEFFRTTDKNGNSKAQSYKSYEAFKAKELKRIIPKSQVI